MMTTMEDQRTKFPETVFRLESGNSVNVIFLIGAFQLFT